MVVSFLLAAEVNNRRRALVHPPACFSSSFLLLLTTFSLTHLIAIEALKNLPSEPQIPSCDRLLPGQFLCHPPVIDPGEKIVLFGCDYASLREVRVHPSVGPSVPCSYQTELTDIHAQTLY